MSRHPKNDPEATPKAVGPLMERVFHEAHQGPVLTLNRLRQHWAGIVGEPLARATHPTRLLRGVLWVAAPDSGWAFNLQFVKADVLNGVRTFLASEAVKEVRFKVGELQLQDAATVPPGDGPATTTGAEPPVGEPDAAPPGGSSGIRRLTAALQAPRESTGAAEPPQATGGAEPLAPPAPPAADVLGKIADPRLREVFRRLGARLKSRE